MTEEQFWHSNPRIIKVWEKAYRLKQNRLNETVHAWVGNYVLSAMSVAIEHCLSKKAKSKYVEKPIKLFESDEEEKQIEAMKARKAFLMWANRTQKKYEKKGG